ncbi:MAG TPA: response regulator transcription factor [Mobilitalea sp.]|nr:response regulator transcription factor [Mobilitalea sp.]
MDGSPRKILVVEDEEKIASVIKSFLESKGFFVLCAADGRKAIDVFNREQISLVLLDLMLPVMTGEEVCRYIRQKSRIPIIMLTAKSEETDMLKGLGIGADDYIMKPFSFRTLYARMEAVLRRSAEELIPQHNQISFHNGDLIINFQSRSIMKNSEVVKLTPNEYGILSVLIKYSNKVFTRDELIASAFGDDFEGYDRTIDSHIKNLRAKIESDPKNPVYVKTIHGVGYKFGGVTEGKV